MAKERTLKDQFRFGIGEWYGQSFVHLTTEQRLAYAQMQAMEKKQRPAQACPFRGGTCTKTGGVCSLRLYHRAAATATVVRASERQGILRATRPNRFHEGRLIFSWIGEVLLGAKEPRIVAEVGFLEGERIAKGRAQGDDFGRIDHVLVHPGADPMRWCALEIQAVYFLGATMGAEFAMLRDYHEPGVPLPAKHRRPDYRSSGPRRLIPSLELLKRISPCGVLRDFARSRKCRNGVTTRSY